MKVFNWLAVHRISLRMEHWNQAQFKLCKCTQSTDLKAIKKLWEPVHWCQMREQLEMLTGNVKC